MTKPVTDGAGSEVHPAAPIPRHPQWSIRAKLHRADPKIVVELFRHIVMLVDFVQVGNLAIDVFKGVTAGVNRMHLANGPGPDPLAELANGAAGMTLVAELSNDFVLVSRSHQRTGFLEGGRGILLVAEPLAEFLRGRGEFRERIDETADHHRRDILDDIDEHRLVQHQMHGAAHPRIVERLFLVVDPGRLDHALVVIGRSHSGGRLGFPRRDRVGDADIIDPPGEDRRRHLRGKRQDVLEFDPVKVR